VSPRSDHVNGGCSHFVWEEKGVDRGHAEDYVRWLWKEFYRYLPVILQRKKNLRKGSYNGVPGDYSIKFWCIVGFRKSSACCLYSNDNNCMLNTPTGDTINITEYPGQRYSVDKQCQIMHGPDSFYCAVSPKRLYPCTFNVNNIV